MSTDTDWLRQRIAEERARRSAELAAAREEAKRSGKEPFHFDRLWRLYDVSPDLAPPEWTPTDEVKARYEYKYYVLCPHIRTLRGFAGFLEEVDLLDS